MIPAHPDLTFGVFFRLKSRTAEMEHERTQYEMFLRAVIEQVIEHKTIIQVGIIFLFDLTEFWTLPRILVSTLRHKYSKF